MCNYNMLSCITVRVTGDTVEEDEDEQVEDKSQVEDQVEDKKVGTHHRTS